MNVKFIAEVIENFYYVGRVKNNKTLATQDFEQMVKFAFGNIMRNLWYASKKADEGDEYYFFTGSLLSKPFDLPKADGCGKRRIDMSKTPVVRLPQNRHIFKINLLDEGCGTDCNEVTLVQPGEENFYTGPEMRFFMFGVPKGAGIDTYHIPDCVQKVEVEAAYDDEQADIPYDIAFDICNQILGISLKVKGWPVDITDDANPNLPILQQRLNQQAQQQV